MKLSEEIKKKEIWINKKQMYGQEKKNKCIYNNKIEWRKNKLSNNWPTKKWLILKSSEGKKIKM